MAGARKIIGRLFVQSSPMAASRAASLQSNSGGFPRFITPFGFSNIGSELDNVPAAALPSILLFILLTVLYVIILGPANFLVLRRFRRRELLWVTIPLGALFCTAATFGVAYRAKGRHGTDQHHQHGDAGRARRSAPCRCLYGALRSGARRLHADLRRTRPASIRPAVQLRWPRLERPPHRAPLPGGGTDPGTVRGDEHVVHAQCGAPYFRADPGQYRERVARGTQRGYRGRRPQRHFFLALVHPAIIAGRSFVRLPDMPAESTVLPCA